MNDLLYCLPARFAAIGACVLCTCLRRSRPRSYSKCPVRRVMKRILRAAFLAIMLLLPVGAALWPLPARPGKPAVAGLPSDRFSVDALAMVTPQQAREMREAGVQIVRVLL